MTLLEMVLHLLAGFALAVVWVFVRGLILRIRDNRYYSRAFKGWPWDDN